MLRDIISKVTIRRRGKAERKKVQAEKDNERRAKKIEELTNIRTERSPARESCPIRKVECIKFAPDYNSEPTSHPLGSCESCCENKTDCLYELKDADGKCDHCHTYKMHWTNQPEITDYAPSKQWVLRHFFAFHTAPWYKSLSLGDQNKYKAKQIQVSSIPKFDGPCQRCVVRGLPCRMLNPNSKIAEFTRPSRCALCIVDVSRGCTSNDYNITHSEHEASLPLFTGNIPLLWAPLVLERPTPASVECSEKESPTFIPSPLKNESPTLISSPLENEVTTQCPLDSAEVQESLEAIHRFVDYTLDKLASENIIRDDCLPFSGSNIAQMNDRDRNNRKSITTVSLLLKALWIMNLSDIPDYFQSSSLEKLSMRTIFRALVSRYVLEAVFSRMPKDTEDLRACIQPHLQGK